MFDWNSFRMGKMFLYFLPVYVYVFAALTSKTASTEQICKGITKVM